jgi:O-antigen/teichoic acid export membrane protein
MAICLAAIWYASRGYARLQLLRGFKFKILKKNISYYSAGISLGVLSSFAGIYVVRTVIVAFGEDTAGIYSATSRFSSVYLGVIFGTTTSYFYPTVTQLNTDLEIGNEISKTLRLFQIVLTPTMIGLIIFYSPIIQILLSGRFIESGQLLAYQMPGDIFRLSFEIIVLTLLARGYPKAFVGCHVVWFIVYLGLVTGAAQLFNTVESICMAYSITYALVGLTASWLVPHFTGWQIAKSAYLTTTFSILFLLLASLTSLSSLSVIQKYAIGILLLVGWIGIHIRDPSAQKLINRLLSRSSRK